MLKTLKVSEVANELNITESGVYKRLKKGSLYGFKDKNNEWSVFYSKYNNQYLSTLYSKYVDNKNTYKQMKELIKKQEDLDSQFVQFSDKVGWYKHNSKTEIIKSTMADEINRSQEKIESEITESIHFYDDVVTFFKDVPYDQINYSKKSRSLYVRVNKKHIHILLNKTSGMNVKVLSRASLFDNDTEKVIRFSDHINPTTIYDLCFIFTVDNKHRDALKIYNQAKRLSTKNSTEFSKKDFEDLNNYIEELKDNEDYTSFVSYLINKKSNVQKKLSKR